MDMGDRIKNLREENRMTLEEVGRIVGVGKSTVRKWETGEIANMRRDKIAKLAEALHTTPGYLMGWTDSPKVAPPVDLPDNIIPLPSTVKIPLVGSIACGTPVLAVENLEGYIDMPDHVHADFALRCKGDSMIGARIFDGDIVYIKKQDIVEDGQIAAVLIGEEATLKRVRFYPDHIVLEPANPAIEPWAYWREEMNEVHVIGLAVAFTSMVRH
jgi:repressor LexA